MKKQFKILCCLVVMSAVLSVVAARYNQARDPVALAKAQSKAVAAQCVTQSIILRRKPGGNMAGPTFRAGSNGSVSGTTVTATKPTGTVNNDIMIASIVKTNAAAVTPPSGWALIKKQLAGSGALETYTYWKLAASEGSSYAWGVGSSSDAQVFIDTYSNADVAIPAIFDGAAPGNTASPTAPSVTSIYPDSLLFCVFAVGNSHSITQPSGMTDRGGLSAGTNAIRVCDLALPSAGATGTKTASISVGQETATQSIIIAPFGAAPADANFFSMF